MEAVAHLRFARISVRKARVILDLVRGQNVAEALDQLRFTRKAAAPMVGKLIDSAIANAQQRDENVKLDRLYVKRAWADKAPGRFLIRWRPRAQGRATPVQKGIAHLTVVVDERGGSTAGVPLRPAPRTPSPAAAPRKAQAKSTGKAAAKAEPVAKAEPAEKVVAPVKDRAAGRTKGKAGAPGKDKAPGKAKGKPKDEA